MLFSNFERLSWAGRWDSCLRFSEIGAVIDHFYRLGCFRSLLAGLGDTPDVWRESNESKIERIAQCNVPPIAFHQLLETFFRCFFGAQPSGTDESALTRSFLDQARGVAVECLSEIASEPIAAVGLVVVADHEGGVGRSEDKREQKDNDFDRVFAVTKGFAEEEDVCVGKPANWEDDPK
jgi:hypothetical protein